MKKQIVSLIIILALTVTVIASCADPNELVKSAELIEKAESVYADLDSGATPETSGKIAEEISSIEDEEIAVTEGLDTFEADGKSEETPEKADDQKTNDASDENENKGQGNVQYSFLKDASYEDKLGFLSQLSGEWFKGGEMDEEFVLDARGFANIFVTVVIFDKAIDENKWFDETLPIVWAKKDKARDNYERVYPTNRWAFDEYGITKQDVESWNEAVINYFLFSERYQNMRNYRTGEDDDHKLRPNYDYYTQEFIDALFSNDYDYMVSILKHPTALYRDGIVYSYYKVVYDGGAEKLFADGMTKEELRQYLNNVKQYIENDCIKANRLYDERFLDLDAQIAWLCDGTPLPDGVWCPPTPGKIIEN